MALSFNEKKRLEETMWRNALAACAALGTGSAAYAGGFSADVLSASGLLGDPSRIEVGVIVSSPDVSYASVDGQPTSGVGAKDWAETAVLPRIEVLKKWDRTACALQYARPNWREGREGELAIAAGFAAPGETATQSRYVKSQELALTCSYGFDVGPGQAYLIGGVYGEHFDLFRERVLNTGTGILYNAAKVQADGIGYGFRLGAGYARPERAQKVSIVYRSPARFDLDGKQNFASFAGFGPLSGAEIDGYVEFIGPESVRLEAQTGLSPKWLVFGSVQWTNWDRVQTLDFLSSEAIPALGISPGDPAPRAPQIEAFFKDTWTIEAGVGHKFSDRLRGRTALTWDEGASTGYSPSFDRWIASAGFSYAVTEKLSFSLGGAVAYLEGGEYQDGKRPGARDVTLDDSFAYGVRTAWRYQL